MISGFAFASSVSIPEGVVSVLSTVERKNTYENNSN